MRAGAGPDEAAAFDAVAAAFARRGYGFEALVSGYLSYLDGFRRSRLYGDHRMYRTLDEAAQAVAGGGGPPLGGAAAHLWFG